MCVCVHVCLDGRRFLSSVFWVQLTKICDDNRHFSAILTASLSSLNTSESSLVSCAWLATSAVRLVDEDEPPPGELQLL